MCLENHPTSQKTLQIWRINTFSHKMTKSRDAKFRHIPRDFFVFHDNLPKSQMLPATIMKIPPTTMIVGHMIPPPFCRLFFIGNCLFLFYCHGFSQISWLVHIKSSFGCNIKGEELSGNDSQKRACHF